MRCVSSGVDPYAKSGALGNMPIIPRRARLSPYGVPYQHQVGLSKLRKPSQEGAYYLRNTKRPGLPAASATTHRPKNDMGDKMVAANFLYPSDVSGAISRPGWAGRLSQLCSVAFHPPPLMSSRSGGLSRAIASAMSILMPRGSSRQYGGAAELRPQYRRFISRETSWAVAHHQTVVRLRREIQSAHTCSPAPSKLAPRRGQNRPLGTSSVQPE